MSRPPVMIPSNCSRTKKGFALNDILFLIVSGRVSGADFSAAGSIYFRKQYVTPGMILSDVNRSIQGLALNEILFLIFLGVFRARTFQLQAQIYSCEGVRAARCAADDAETNIRHRQRGLLFRRTRSSRGGASPAAGTV